MENFNIEEIKGIKYFDKPLNELSNDEKLLTVAYIGLVVLNNEMEDLKESCEKYQKLDKIRDKIVEQTFGMICKIMNISETEMMFDEEGVEEKVLRGVYSWNKFLSDSRKNREVAIELNLEDKLKGFNSKIFGEGNVNPHLN